MHTGKNVHWREIHPDFETQGRCHQKSKNSVSMAPYKGLMYCTIYSKKLGDNLLDVNLDDNLLDVNPDNNLP